MKPSAFGFRLTRQPALLLGLLGLFWFGAACSNMALGEMAPATMVLGEMAPATMALGEVAADNTQTEPVTVLAAEAKGKIRPEAQAFDKLFARAATEQALQQLSTKMALSDSSRGQFEQVRWLRVLKQPLRSSGEFLFQRELGMLWQQQTPFGNLLLLKQGELIQQDSQGKLSVTKADAGPAAVAEMLPRMMQSLLSGDIQALSQGFELYLLNDQAGHWQLGLKAKEQTMAALLPQMVLEGNKELESLTLLAKNGDISQIFFSELDKSPLNDSERARFFPEVAP
ncbi:LolA family protein [Shewanella chilikensis]|uniref:Outer membrane lipoprotein carrier protein LolA n=1 Tax=Shewanella chilikensis TaxID=558541 RepID=A0A6G7LX33_9GAMM|nr:outer membrane lipoprotein carrier protein LolA [Shewanella chilikensis]QIJ06300.1 outer membrane lipoprotein carrier protein LolA [Shewanella chilikensis]